MLQVTNKILLVIQQLVYKVHTQHLYKFIQYKKGRINCLKVIEHLCPTISDTSSIYSNFYNNTISYKFNCK